MATTLPQNTDNVHQNKVLPISEKTEQPPQQNGMMTPPMSPINTSLSSNRPGTAKSSLKITAGQTGLPWLTHDAGGENFSPVQSSPEEMESRPTSPPPKFQAIPRTTSIIRVPTRKRTMQKHIYSMKDGLDPVKVLCNRMKYWEISIKYMIRMFQNIKKVESNSGKGYRKIDAKFSFPKQIENQFKSSNGVKDAWSAFRQYTRENSLIHQDFVDFIENEIIPILHVMIKDIHSYTNKLKHDKELHTTALWDTRKKSDKIITRLNSDIYATLNSQEKAKGPYVIPKRDPLLTKYDVINAIQELYKHENRLHKAFLDTQDRYRQFENERIIHVYTEVFRTFEQYRVEHRLEHLESVTKVANVFGAIETDSEWLDFLQHNQNSLVKQTAAFKNERELDFPNIDHPLVQPIIYGNLQKHHGKKWTEEYYILSPVGLLHRFKSEKHFHEHPARPETTMFVPESHVLVNPTSHLLELKGKALAGGIFGGGSKKMLELSSAQPSELKRWIDTLGPMAQQKETAVLHSTPPAAVAAAGAATAAAVDTRSIHSKQLAPENDQIEHQAGSSALGNEAAAIPTAATTADDVRQETPVEQQQQPVHMNEEKAPMHINDENAPMQSSPIQRENGQGRLVEEDDDDDTFKNETIEYSQHPPLDGSNIADEHNPFVQNNATPVANTAEQPAAKSTPHGPTREGSELYWDSIPTPTLQNQENKQLTA